MGLPRQVLHLFVGQDGSAIGGRKGKPSSTLFPPPHRRTAAVFRCCPPSSLR